MSEIRKFRVLAVADGMIPSVDLVLARPLAYLAEQGALDYTLRMMSSEDLGLELERCDLLLLMRACQPDALRLVEDANERGIPVIYAIDDDFETLDPETPLGRYYQETKAWERLLTICSKSAQVWAFSDALKRKIGPVQQCIVVPPAIASFEMIDSLRAEQGQPQFSNGARRVIGYAATRYHSVDIDSIAQSLKYLLDDAQSLEIEFVGVRCESLAEHPRVRHFEQLPSLDEYYSFVLSRQWDIGLAPLLRNAANDAKTDNKYREYAALGIPAVYADAPPYWKSVIDGYNGVVASGLDGWLEALKSLLQDQHFACQIASNARADIEKRYSVRAVSERYERYMRSAMDPILKVLVIAADIPTTDIDIVRPFDRLYSEGKIEWKRLDGMSISQSDIQWADILVVSRYSDVATVNIVRQAKSEFQIPVIFTWDDDFFVIPESLGPAAMHHRDPLIVRGLVEILSTADLVKASTARIAERSGEYNKNVVTIPYGFDFSQLEGLDEQHHAHGDWVTIGFFGSLSHSAALEAVLGALHRVADLSGRVKFEFFGPKTEKLEKLPRSTFIPYSNSSSGSLRTLMSRKWDIGLAPLEVNEFNRAKLPTKYRDYGACHIAGIYTRIDPYENAVKNGLTGILVNNEEEAWVEAIMRLVNEAPLRRNIAANAHAHVRNELSLDQAVDAWRMVFDQLVPANEDSKESDAKYQRKIRAMEARIEHLTKQVDSLKESARTLLYAHGMLHRNAPSPSLPRRAINRVVRRFLPPISAELLPAAPSHAVRKFAEAIVRERKCGHEDLKFRISSNLQQVAFVEYPVLHHPINGSILRVALAATVPTLSGHIGAEIVSPDDVIIHHLVVSMDSLSPEMLVDFPVHDLNIREHGWRFRFFARGSECAVHVRECLPNSATPKVVPLFTLIEVK